MIEIKIGDCAQRLKDLDDNSVDAIICDPPYGLKFMSKGWDDIGDGSQQREWHRAWLTESYRVLKKDGVIRAFSGTRTFHHLARMMEIVGFQDLSVEAWVYGSGFPKSHNLSKQFEKKSAQIPVRDLVSDEAKKWRGWGTALKPSWEPICVGYKR